MILSIKCSEVPFDVADHIEFYICRACLLVSTVQVPPHIFDITIDGSLAVQFLTNAPHIMFAARSSGS